MGTLVIKRRRGSYCARIEGTDPKYHLARVFQDGKATKGLLTFTLEPGWYEVSEGWTKVAEEWTKPKTYYRVLDTCEKIADELTGYIGEASEGPTPGEDGEWSGSRCECGADVETVTTSGFPKCAEHAAKVDSGPELVPA